MTRLVIDAVSLFCWVIIGIINLQKKEISRLDYILAWGCLLLSCVSIMVRDIL